MAELEAWSEVPQTEALTPPPSFSEPEDIAALKSALRQIANVRPQGVSPSNKLFGLAGAHAHKKACHMALEALAAQAHREAEREYEQRARELS